MIELNENDSLDQFTKNLVMRQLPKIGVNLSANFDIDEVEINDTELIHQGVFLNNSILNSSKYLSIVENQYIENKRFSPEDLKKYIFIFISPIDDSIKQKAAYVIREDIYLFSAMIFSFSIEAVFHEIAHELGLKHTFVDDDKTLSINNENLANLKEHNNKLIRKVEDWEKIYLKNESFNYENKKINKKEFRHIIDEKKEEIKKKLYVRLV
ncbi:hypothetical protein [Capnocytophaga catalasegens]|uniref:Uncharacterized protein n=1 Tax=Capnocytophaga catalasegens TaxID=1004260 RepID=A0AAV5ARI1_9FLAO|nr:hypothetical protein [Capnocytophaga catalasegens]GIZ14140.1 hypothetical protein RCZ03_01410 [Capnocytophaga catalasegens]GJM49934.1 hypothetical protein RCZ15_09090 [Capnocytophaga catalasegens]GJM51705.1 hypothetical protein RCZ16_00230 [Capnocytophaga catalasegens]